MSLEIEIHTGQQNCTYNDLNRVWRLADSYSFYWVSVWDHFLEAPARDWEGTGFEAIALMTALPYETTNSEWDACCSIWDTITLRCGRKLQLL